MAETKKPARATNPPPLPSRAVPLPPPRTEAGELIEDVNDQLARFLEHADQLVEEWAKFATDVRRTVDTEVARIDAAVADATERALENASAKVDRLAAERIEKTVEHAVARWRGDPPARVASGGGGTSAAGATAGASRGLLAAVILANVLLVVLLVVSLTKGSSSAAPGGSDGSSGGGVTTIIAPEVLAACDSLAEGTWSPDDAALVLRAGTAVCGDDEAKVTATVTAHFAAPEAPIDAGVVDATPPIDAKKKSGK